MANDQRELYKAIRAWFLTFKRNCEKSDLGIFPTISKDRDFFNVDLNEALASFDEVAKHNFDKESIDDYVLNIQIARSTFQAYAYKTQRANEINYRNLDHQLARIVAMSKQLNI